MSEQSPPQNVDFDAASGNAARLLQWAENELDLAKQRQMNDLANFWLALADLIHERQQT